MLLHFAQPSMAMRLQIYLPEGTTHAVDERLAGHLQAEEGHGPTRHRNMHGDVTGHGRLANRRPRTKDGQLLRLESGREIVQAPEAGRNAGQPRALLKDFVDAGIISPDILGHRSKSGSDRLAGNPAEG